MQMNKYLALLLLALLIPASLVAISCSGQKAAAPGTNATSAPSQAQPEAPQVNIPTTDKSKAPVVQFAAAPAQIARGGTAVLSWTVTGATSVTIDHGVGAVSLTGTKSVSPAVPTTYKLIAANEEGLTTVKLVSVAVTAASTTPAPKSSK
jgi:hypothetical protein